MRLRRNDRTRTISLVGFRRSALLLLSDQLLGLFLPSFLHVQFVLKARGSRQILPNYLMMWLARQLTFSMPIGGRDRLYWPLSALATETRVALGGLGGGSFPSDFAIAQSIFQVRSACARASCDADVEGEGVLNLRKRSLDFVGGVIGLRGYVADDTKVKGGFCDSAPLVCGLNLDSNRFPELTACAAA